MADLPRRKKDATEPTGEGRREPAKVEIYTWRFCPYCIRAKGLLDRKG